MDAWEVVRHALQATRGGANEQVEAMADVIRTGAWRRFALPGGEVQEHTSLRKFVETPPNKGLGISNPKAWAESLAEHSNLKRAANDLVRAIDEQTPPLAKHGEIGNGRGSDTTSTVDPDRDSTYVIARLKRDDPELAEQVIAGSITPNAAAIQAGIRRRYIRCRADDVNLAVASLLRVYTADEIRGAL